MTKQAFFIFALAVALQCISELAILHVSHCFRDVVLILQLPSHACCAGTPSVARAHTLREDARTRRSTDRAVLHCTAV